MAWRWGGWRIKPLVNIKGGAADVLGTFDSVYKDNDFDPNESLFEFDLKHGADYLDMNTMTIYSAN